jgi:hypothetical protein
MTPNVRSIYEGTVVPLLGAYSLHEQMETRSLNNRVNAAKWRWAPWEQTKLEKREAGLEKLVGKVAKAMESPAVIAAMREVDTPIVLGGGGGGGGSGSGGGGDAGVTGQPAADGSAAAARGRASAMEDSKLPAPPPETKKARRSTVPNSSNSSNSSSSDSQGASSPLVDLLLHHPDLAATVLDHLGSGSAHRGIGATAPALRTAVMAALPRLVVNNRRLQMDHRREDASAFRQRQQQTVRRALPRLERYPRLLHLTVGGGLTPAEATKLEAGIVAAGLPARLESFHAVRSQQAYDSTSPTQGTRPLCADLLDSHDWPRLRALEVGLDMHACKGFLDAVLARPAAVFPRLQSLSVHALDVDMAGKLLALLDRGAFPALTALVPPTGEPRAPRYADSHMCSVVMEVGAEDGLQQQCAALRRLPDTAALHIHSSRASGAAAAAAAWTPVAALLLEGGLANLKYGHGWYLCVCLFVLFVLFV